jgi:hypothetical protein
MTDTTKVDHILSRVGGQAGGAAVVLAPDGHSVLAEWSYRAGEAFPLASSFKLFVLHALLEDAAAGRIDLDAQIPTRRAEASLGDRKPQLSSLRRLAEMMIYQSGNTASDVLFKRIGLGRPQELIERLGLEHTRVVLPTREYYVIIAGLDPEFPPEDLPAAAARFAALPPSEQAATIERVAVRSAGLSLTEIEQATLDFYAYKAYPRPQAYAILDHVDNMSTPVAMLRLMRYLHAGGDLPAPWAAEMQRILVRSDGARDAGCFHGRARAWGGKGGSDLSQASMNGYAVAADGRILVYSLLAAHLHDDWRGSLRLSEAAGTLWRALIEHQAPDSR